MIPEEIKKIEWQKYITRETSFASEHLMHEGWQEFIQTLSPLLRFNRLNVYTNGIATMYASKDDIEDYRDYFKKEFLRDKLAKLFSECKKRCIDFKKWNRIFQVEIARAKTSTDFSRLYEEMSCNYRKMAVPLILPRLIGKALESIDTPDSKKALNTFAVLNEERKELVTSFEKLRSVFFTKIAPYVKQNPSTLSFMLPSEISNLLEERKSSYRKNTRTNCLYAWINAQTYILNSGYASYAKKLSEQKAVQKFERVFGKTASPGYVTGKAVLIQKNSDYEKVLPGSIIVCPMTQPDIVLVLGKIAGIITDEGGTLTHAAILAREYGLPCITATKIATQCISEGDTVSLNAGGGYFRILSKSLPSIEKISYTSICWGQTETRKCRQKIILYGSRDARKLFVWLPGMTEVPSVCDANPLLSEFTNTSIKNNNAVAVFDFGQMENRTLSTMRQNVLDGIRALTLPPHTKITLVGRSASGTLVGMLVNEDFSKFVILSGRLHTASFAKQIARSPEKFPKINSKYIQELLRAHKTISDSFKKANKRKTVNKILALQAKDDDMVPFQLDSWKSLGDRYQLNTKTYCIPSPAGHSIISETAIKKTVDKIMSFSKQN